MFFNNTDICFKIEGLYDCSNHWLRRNFEGSKSPKSGKYSFSEKRRTQIFKFAIDEIWKYSNCKIAICKESGKVWKDTRLELSKCSCVCQLDYADMS